MPLERHHNNKYSSLILNEKVIVKQKAFTSVWNLFFPSDVYLICIAIIIKDADKSSEVVVWDREDYLKEASKELEDKDVYKEVKMILGPLSTPLCGP